MKRNPNFLPQSKYPIYNDSLNRMMTQSKIFNGGNDKPSSRTYFFDKLGVESYIIELQGLEDGRYRKNNETTLAKIPLVKAQIAQIEMNFEKYKVNRINQGFAEPETMTKEIKEEYEMAHARLTLLEGELIECQKRLEEFKKDDPETIDEDKILQFGLRCFSKLHNGIISKIDGQHCSQLDSGIMIIDDSRSPYHGMSCADYRSLSKKWLADLADSDRKKLLRLKSDAKQKGERIPQSLPVKSMRRVNINSLPKFPDWAINHLANIESDSTVTK